jgi:putative ATP-grasp target RiPP
MFTSSDRFPVGRPPQDAPGGVRPWGVRRMAPFAHTIDVGFVATGIDPAMQMGVGRDGELITAKHRKSNTGTENQTGTSRGDGAGHGEDQDHTQDSDQD